MSISTATANPPAPSTAKL